MIKKYFFVCVLLSSVFLQAMMKQDSDIECFALSDSSDSDVENDLVSIRQNVYGTLNNQKVELKNESNGKKIETKIKNAWIGCGIVFSSVLILSGFLVFVYVLVTKSNPY